MQPSRRDAVAVALASVAFAASTGPAPGQSTDVVVFAAASLKNAFDEAALLWKAQSGHAARLSYAASNTLARQIEQGAPADIFVSADTDWMDYLAGKDLIQPKTRANLLGNSIVLVAPSGSKLELELKPGIDLNPALAGGRLAMANVDAVPAGKYGRAALERLGVWAGLKDKVVQAENVRAALLLVARGEAPLGIVYKTDAVSEPGVRIVGTFADALHPPIVYPIALTRASPHPEAASLLAFLRSSTCRPVFERQGFSVLRGAASAT